MQQEIQIIADKFIRLVDLLEVRSDLTTISASYCYKAIRL